MASGDQLDLTFRPVAPRVWTVRGLVAAVRTLVEREYTDIWVEGEISNFRPAESGHIYFTLKDGDAQVRVVIFRSQARLLRFKPQDGMQVVARGRITVYDARGELQISAEYLEPKGAGALQMAFEQLKAKLGAEGLFDESSKKPIPVLPRRIGVVTSPRGAAVRDIINVLRRRHSGVHVLIYPAQVQGEAAATEVSAGIRYFNRSKDIDVIIVARGGGSMEDLAAFNHEGLARVVSNSKLPVISAIGHETDFTIIDFVADLRAPTPSAAAELVVRSKQEWDEQAESFRRRLARGMRYQLLMRRQTLTEIAQHGAFARMREAIGRRQQRLDDLRFRLLTAERRLLEQQRRNLDHAAAAVRHFDVRQRVAGMRRDLTARINAFTSAGRAFLVQQRARIDHLQAQMEALSPVAILDRGYALIFDANGNLVKDAAQVETGQEITARVARGRIKATIKEREPGS